METAIPGIMKVTRTKILWVTAFVVSLASCDTPEDVAGCRFPDLNAYELVWSDEFDGPEIDLDKWSFEIGDGCDHPNGLCGWGNNELQYYTDRPENAFINDQGHLVIKAIKEEPQYEGYDYTSARMLTYNKGDWKFGRMDIRARLPIGRGMWPAIWMLPSDTVYGTWPRSGEIDIMEAVGHETDKVLGTIHFGMDRHRYNEQRLHKTPGVFYEEFHTYTLLWNEDCILFQVDGEDLGVPNTRSTTLPTTWPFDQYFHMILNVAVGGNLPGNPDANTQFPQVMEVDYVRVYQPK